MPVTTKPRRMAAKCGRAFGFACGTWVAASLVLKSLSSVLPNKRLKLAAPRFKGSVMFVNNQTARRSLSTIR
jgi:hypothetical protein